MKTCTACGTSKPLEDFYADRRASDGKRSDCKQCTNERRDAWASNNRDIVNARVRRRNQRNPEPRQRHYKKWRTNNPEKYLAHKSVYAAIKRGTLVRPDTCEACGQVAYVQAHHEDYARRLDVRWLCRLCHRSLHERLAASPQAGDEETA